MQPVSQETPPDQSETSFQQIWSRVNQGYSFELTDVMPSTSDYAIGDANLPLCVSSISLTAPGTSPGEEEEACIRFFIAVLIHLTFLVKYREGDEAATPVIYMTWPRKCTHSLAKASRPFQWTGSTGSIIIKSISSDILDIRHIKSFNYGF